jgi:AraC family transcriptional activator of pobA
MLVNVTDHGRRWNGQARQTTGTIRTIMTDRTFIPAFALYGDADTGITPAFLHIETISARSALHDWEISPHRHMQSVQVLLIQSGHVRMTVDGQQAELAGPAFVLIAAGSVHGFRFTPNSVGHVITASNDMLMRGRVAGDPIIALASRGAHGPVELDERIRLDHYAAELMALDAANRLDDPLAMALFEVLVRSLPVARQLDADGPDERAARFRRLVEQHLHEQRPISFYADQMGLTERTLTRLCRQHLGTSPHTYVQTRLAFEARRLLLYTNGTVAQIAEQLGFVDPSYFARFYRRLTGRAPSDDR